MGGLLTNASVTGSFTLEAALVKNADGSTISNPQFYNCTKLADGSWNCYTAAPDGTYPAEAQQLRLKGSNPAVTAYGFTAGKIVGSGTSNQAPSVTINGSASGTAGTQQSFQAIASDSDGTISKVELLLMTNATTTTQFTVLDTDTVSPYVLNWTPTSAGKFNLRTRATDNGGATSFSSVLAVQVATAGGGAKTLTFTDADFGHNMRHGADGTDRHSPFADVLVDTDAPYADVTYNNVKYSDSGIAAFVGGAFSSYNTANATGVVTTRLALSGSGMRQVQFVESLQGADTPDVPPIGYTTIQSISFPAGYSATKVAPLAPGNDVMLILGDSITVSALTAIPQTQGWVQQLFKLRPTLYAIGHNNYGSKKTTVALGNASTRATMVQEAVAAWGSSTKKRYYIALGTNDRSEDPTTCANLIGAYVDALHTAAAEAILYVQLPFKYVAGDTDGLRAAYQQMAASRTDYVRVLDLATPSLKDQLHPDAAGYATMANEIHQKLDAVAAQFTEPILLRAWEGSNQDGYWEDQGNGQNNAVEAKYKPQLVQNAVFGKAAYRFGVPSAGLQWLKLNALASQPQAVTMLLTLRGTSTSAQSQFVVDCAAGRIAFYLNGLNGDNSSVYIAPDSGSAGGSRGVALNPQVDTFISLVLTSTAVIIGVDGNTPVSYAGGPLRFSTPIVLGASYGQDQNQSDAGQFFGYLGAFEMYPTALSNAAIQDRRTALVAGGAPPTTEPSGTVLAQYERTDFTYGSSWQDFATSDSLSGGVYYTSTVGDPATRAIAPAQGAVVQFFQNHANSYGTTVVKLDGVRIGSFTAYSANNTGADPTTPVYTTPTIPAGSHTLSVESETLNGRSQIIVDRIKLVAA